MFLLHLVLPSTPRNASATFVNQSAVEITWLPPSVTGDTSHVFYKIVCRRLCNINDEKKCVEESCGSDVSYIPDKEGLNATQVIVTNLLSFMNYTFKIYAMNRVSEVAKRKHGVEGNFTTITTRTTGTSEFVKFTKYFKYTMTLLFLIVTYFRGNLILRKWNGHISRDLVRNKFSRVFNLAIFTKSRKTQKLSPAKISTRAMHGWTILISGWYSIKR